MDQERLSRAIAAIDAANERDPRGRERTYGERMTSVLARLEPAPSEELQLAVRAQHLERWVVPRDAYPRDRPGYLRWRSDAAKHHAERVGEILRDIGYDEEAIGRVRSLVLKKRLKTDPEAQLLEDCACVVFLEWELDEFASTQEEEKVIDILRKTWAKMGERGRADALRLAPTLSARSRSLISRALGA